MRLEGEPLSPKKEVLKCFLEIAGLQTPHPLSAPLSNLLEPTGSPGEGGRVAQGPFLSHHNTLCPMCFSTNHTYADNYVGDFKTRKLTSRGKGVIG